MRYYDTLEAAAYKKVALGLHDIRKLNGVIKITAERLLASGGMPSSHDADLIRIQRTSDMMSQLFLAIHAMAEEEIMQLPTKSMCHLYPLFDKITRIYEPDSGDRTLLMSAKPSGYGGPIFACDLTIPLIPSVLIKNAFKYSEPGGVVRVQVERSSDEAVVQVTVSNHCRRGSALSDSVFIKGHREYDDNEGSGVGLYIAKQVAKQHGGDLTLDSRMVGAERCECAFVLRLPEAKCS